MINNRIVDERVIGLEGVRLAAIELNMRAGKLEMAGGASELVDARFEYSNSELRPEVEIERENGAVNVSIEQPRTQHRSRNEINNWDIRLNNAIPITLNVRMASAAARYDLTEVNLSTIDIRTASGSTDVIFGGDYTQLSEVALNSASGMVRLDLAGRFHNLRQIDLESASGSMTVDLTGEYQILDSCVIRSASGSIELDLSGEWRQDVNVRVNATSGSISIKTPPNFGVAVAPRVISGNVRAHQFHVEGRELVNDLYGKSDVTLQLIVRATSGSISIE